MDFLIIQSNKALADGINDISLRDMIYLLRKHDIQPLRVCMI